MGASARFELGAIDLALAQPGLDGGHPARDQPGADEPVVGVALLDLVAELGERRRHSLDRGAVRWVDLARDP